MPSIFRRSLSKPAVIRHISPARCEMHAMRVHHIGQPISIPDGYGAQILATGTDYLGRSVSAQAFINSTAKGQYTLFGVAPGTYNITAYAAGYIPTTRPTTVSVLAEQSLEGVDIYMKHSANVTGRVLSICGGQPIPWGRLSIVGNQDSITYVERRRCCVVSGYVWWKPHGESHTRLFRFLDTVSRV